MSRRAVCKKCADWWVAAIGHYPGEFIKVVRGLCILDEFYCDSCGKTVFGSDEAACVTLMMDERKLDQHWEHEFIMQHQIIY